MFRRLAVNFIFLSFVFVVPLISYASAHLRINEIMYNPEGSDVNHEWIELYNDGGESVDLSSWYFWEGNSYHGLHPDGFTQLASGEYAIIVRDVALARSELGSSNHYVRASFSLNNTGELLKIADSAKATVDEISYQSDWGGNGNGKSLQYVDGTWGEGTPTPGRENTLTSLGGNSTEGSGSQTDSGESNSQDESGGAEEVAVQKQSSYHISLPLFTQKIIAGEAFRARVQVKYGDDEVRDGLFLVNFGDGRLLKTRKPVKEYVNRYIHPGRYLFTFEYYSSPFFYEDGEKPEASFRKIINVENRETVTVEKVNPYDGVVIKNNGESEVNLEGWFLRWEGNIYTFPHATILLPYELLRISYRTLGFSPSPTRENKISLVSNANVVVSSYPMPPYHNEKSNFSTRGKKSHVLSSVAKKEDHSLKGEDVFFDTLPSFSEEKREQAFQDYLEKHPGKVFVEFPEENKKETGKEESPLHGVFALVVALILTIISSLIVLVSFFKKSDEEGGEKSKNSRNTYHVELIDEEDGDMDSEVF